MTWWQTLIVAVVPVLLTLLITNWAESKRRAQDATQRELDRQVEAHHRAEARRHALDDHWRAARLNAHRAMLGSLQNCARRMRGMLRIAKNMSHSGEHRLSDLGELIGTGLDELELDELKAVDRAILDVRMYGSEAARTQAGLARDELRRLHHALGASEQSMWDSHAEQELASMAAVESIILSYEDAMRLDLGTG